MISEVHAWTWRLVIASIVAFVLGVIAWLVGKQTPQVWAARLRANFAEQGKLKAAMRAGLEAKQGIRDAQKASDEATSSTILARVKLAELEQKGQAIAATTLALKAKSDQAFADAFNEHARGVAPPLGPR